MAVTYTRVRSLTGLTETDLADAQFTDKLLVEVVKEDVGWVYIFRDEP